MERRSGSTRLVPAGFIVEHTEIDTDCVILVVRAAAVLAMCPCSGNTSHRTQSRYLRQAGDLPIAGRRVTVRRFWCDAVLCRGRILPSGLECVRPQKAPRWGGKGHDGERPIRRSWSELHSLLGLGGVDFRL